MKGFDFKSFLLDIIKAVDFKLIVVKVYISVIRPLVAKYVASTEHTQWDDRVFEIADELIMKLFGDAALEGQKTARTMVEEAEKENTAE